jgi:Dyp-type peroxidase family
MNTHEQIDVPDLQGLIVRGYNKHVAARYLMLKIDDADGARAWLGSIPSAVTPGRPRPAETAVNVAFTWPGLCAIGLRSLSPQTNFAPEFISGMIQSHRSRVLGDFDESDPATWGWGGPANPVDVVLMLFAENCASLNRLTDDHTARFAGHGITVVQALETSNLHGFEQFGFRDGISQPVIEGLSSRIGTPANTVKAGEFILGYANEYGQYADRPMLAAADDPHGLLPRAGNGMADLGRNGTYLVFRTLRQDVDGFHRFLARASSRPDGTSDPEARDHLAARMVGRWPGGAPLVKAPRHDDPALSDFNDFAYHADDRFGLRCPIGAHVRRSNPRDSLDPDPGSGQSVAIGKRHRILRRGREYGPPFTPDQPGDAPAAAERGLQFLCFNANIARQFEFIQFTWINNPKFDGLYDDADPLVGARGILDAAGTSAGPDDVPDGATFTIQARPIRHRVCNVPRFVSVRGGAYFFMPGIRALHYLASLK